MKKAYLTLQNGKTFQGVRFGAEGDVTGELVFTTGMTGYVETLTDPSYYGQIVTQTFPLIGNYGTMSADAESKKSWVSAYIVREKCDEPSNFRSEGKLYDFLKKNNVIGLYGIDTRELTKIVRETGVMNAAITSKPLTDFSELNSYKIENAVKAVTCDEVEYFGKPDGLRIVVWDLGAKNNIIRELLKRGCYCIKVPAYYTAEQILALNPQGLMLTNGPGDPAENVEVIENIKKIAGKLPIFGICLGHQLFAIAMGGKTKKMKYGHRGANQPVKNLFTGRVYVSSQNHGYEVISSSLEGKGELSFVNVNDGTCEGVDYPYLNAFTVQFHPESCGGTRDAVFLFDKFIKNVGRISSMPKREEIKKVLVIGSGPIVIGQAAEFDYAGAQACRVLKAAGVNVVLCNCNPATIMTDKALADEIYLEPLTVDTLKRIILKEKPDSLLASLGGQTGLTLGCRLAKSGFLEEHGVKLIGVNLESIDRAEDRELFKETMQKINQPCVPSDIAYTVEECVKIAEDIGYPVIVRPAYTLGGAGGGVAYDEKELRLISNNGLMLSPITQVLIEKYIGGWKEIEFEVLRDGAGNVLTVCSMENFDPVGIHTGDSIVIAPAVTLSDKEYQMLRTAALNIITELKIEGGCNCQFALNPDSFEYAVIEVNPRVSRSSALASKATGYPIAKVTTQIALGYTLDEIKNDVTGKTYACFEPTVDYVVIKLPKWPFDKFLYAQRTLGTRMKATGEVMAIGTSFEMAIMKAVRGAEISTDTLNLPKIAALSDEEIHSRLSELTDERLFVVYQAIKRGISLDEIFEITKIDRWFLNKLKNLAAYESEISESVISREQYLRGKKLGYSDRALSKISGNKLPAHRNAVFKMVDTCGAEFAAQTPYFYSTYDEKEHDEAKPFVANGKKKRIVVIGSGPIRIGQGIEFDYSSVHCVWALKKMGYEVVIINNNPETVSTDFDTADRLYFEALTPEDVQNVLDIEKPYGVVITFGGQTAIKLCSYLDKKGVRILGTPADSVDLAEDRERFDALLEQFGIARPKGLTVMNKQDAVAAAEKLGYPVLLRPSYVIGGQNMTIAFTQNDIERYMDVILAQKIENPVLCDKYLMGTELEVDAISDGVDVLIPGIMQHIERAGVHSGDSIAVYPPYNLSDAMLKKVVDVSTKLAISLKTKGLINIQYLIYRNELYVIEVNPRASRTIPYISKVTGVPMVDLATEILMGAKLKKLGYGTGLYPNSPYVAVKVPVFSFEKLNDVNSQLGPEMKSTGEVLGIGKTIEEALFKGLVSAGFNMKHPTKQKSAGIYFTINDQDKPEIINIVKKFADLGLNLYATKGTAETIRSLGLECTEVARLSSNEEIFKLMDEGKVDYVVYTGKTDIESISNYISLHHHAILLGITVLTSLDTTNALAEVIAGRYNEFNTELVDINALRKRKLKLGFAKMHSAGNDYIVFDNFKGEITCPESLAINFSDRHYAIGADGVVMIEKSEIADAKVRIFNPDGSECGLAANPIRCVAKYLFDNRLAGETLKIESCCGVNALKVNSFNEKASSVSMDLGKPVYNEIQTVFAGGKEYKCVSVNVGNPHLVLFTDKVEEIDMDALGQEIIDGGKYPADTYLECVRVVNGVTVKMRVWSKINGETFSCGTAAVAAAVAAIVNGRCRYGEIITVKLKGGDLFVKYEQSGEVEIDGAVKQSFEGSIEI